MSERPSWQTTTHDWTQELDLEHLRSVRKQLGQGLAAGGRRHLILEVLAYADDEAHSLGRVGRATVTYHPEGGVTVADDGRGTDTRVDSVGRVIRKPVMATPDVRLVDAPSAPLLPDGLPRRGISTIAALSHVLIHQNHRRDGSWSQTYRHGVPDNALAVMQPRDHNGTSVTFDAPVSGPATLYDSDGFRWLDINVIQLGS